MRSIIVIIFLLLVGSQTDESGIEVIPEGKHKEVICKDPHFDAVLVEEKFDSYGDPQDEYMYFRGENVYKTKKSDSGQRVIDFDNPDKLRFIFPYVSPSTVNMSKFNGLQLAFYKNDIYYFILRGSEEMIEITKDRKSLIRHYNYEQFPYEMITWKVVIEYGSSEDRRQYVFIDMNARKNASAMDTFIMTEEDLDNSFYFRHKGVYYLRTLQNTGEVVDEPKELVLIPKIFPITFQYKGLNIPPEFDTYYQTRYKETVFFKRDSVCIITPMASKADKLTDKQMCRVFTDLRAFIGCFDQNEEKFGRRELDPSIPEIDVEPDV